ncbi:MAG TPA: squalene/phytoene synthase family protein [Bacteroidales bacterium]|nr:squalene/phytoene synthase family protein [Bacteroidales bacterium]
MNKLYLDLYNKIDFKKIIDHPNILIAAAFWEEDRYLAARMCYKYMRAIDDLIDCHKAAHSVISESEREKFHKSVLSWIDMVHNPASGSDNELIDTIKRFHIPLWPLETFARSMIYDIDHNGFATIDDFIEYSQGASVSPASVFVHLNGLTKMGNAYQQPRFDVRAAATPCALFSYIVHIIRDFQKDQQNHLNYFADDVMMQNGLTAKDLEKIAHGAAVSNGFRNMIRVYYKLADRYRQQTFEVIEKICPLLEPRYRLSLMIIFSLYLMVFERINIEKGKFTTEELNPTADEIKERVYKTIIEFENQFQTIKSSSL